MRVRSWLVAVVVLAGSLVAGCGSTPPSQDERNQEAVLRYKEGVALYNDGKVDQAIQNLQKGQELQPEYTLLRFDLGRMYLHRAERAEVGAMRLTDDAARLRKEEKNVDEAKKREAEAAAQRRAATEDMRSALGHLLYVEKKWPQEANASFFLAKVYTGLGDFREARKKLERALSIGQLTTEERQNANNALKMLKDAELQQERIGNNK